MRTVLLLEDHPELAHMFRQILEWRDYQVLTAYTGQEGLDILHQLAAPPDLILCDVLMPDMDGPTFLAHLRATPGWASIPFIVMSAVDPEPQYEVRIQGATGYLTKPFGLEDLDALLLKTGLNL